MDERVDMDLDMRWEQTGAEMVEGWVVGFGFGGYGGVVASDVVVVSREGVG